LKTVKSTTTPRKRTIPTQRSPQKRLMRLALFIVAVIVLGWIGKFVVEKVFFSNPLLGTWRTQTTMGIREIVFERTSMTSFGTKNPVTYDVHENDVVVMDPSLQLGNKYTIIDKNTISTQLGNAKTVFKRVQ
jgi:hypothetical protein